MLDIIIEILTDNNFIGAIFSALGFIIIGFILRHKNIITKDTKKALTFILLNITLPAMAFCAFMTDFSKESFKENIIVFLLSFMFYILLVFIGKLIYIKKPKEDRNIYALFVSIGQITFFTIPILHAVYNGIPEFLIPANMMTLSFRIMLYIYCYMKMARLKLNKDSLKESLKKITLNPIMICMIIGLIIWVTQGVMPKVTINFKEYSIFRIDQTLSSIYMFIKMASNLTTPLAMIVIGSILGDAQIKDALLDKAAWVSAILKTLVLPLLVLLIITGLQALKLIDFNEYSLAVLVLGYSAPVSAVLSTYATRFKNHDQMAGRVCLLSIILSVIAFPLLFILVKYFSTFSIFM